MMTAARFLARRPIRRRTSTKDGEVAFVLASSVPKSLSADTRTRRVSTARARTEGSSADAIP